MHTVNYRVRSHCAEGQHNKTFSLIIFAQRPQTTQHSSRATVKLFALIHYMPCLTVLVIMFLHSMRSLGILNLLGCLPFPVPLVMFIARPPPYFFLVFQVIIMFSSIFSFMWEMEKKIHARCHIFRTLYQKINCTDFAAFIFTGRGAFRTKQLTFTFIRITSL